MCSPNMDRVCSRIQGPKSEICMIFRITYFFVVIILRTYGFLEEKGVSFKKFSLQKIKLLDLTTITLVTMQKCFIIRKTGNRGFRMQNVGT